jgi:hypothetical protein
MKCTTFWPKNLKGRHHLEDLSIDGMIIFKAILKKQGVRVHSEEWIHLVLDRVQWRALAAMAMNLRSA